jgi:hypothetical protein
MIVIVNLRNIKPSQPWDIVIDRSSPLGNPFYMANESQRDTVCDKYQVYFDANCNGKLKQELDRIYEIYKKYGQLRLFCWCFPKRCHGLSIKNYLLNK